MKRIKLVIQYVGTNYCGWQKQHNANSIEEEIEKAIKKELKEDVQVFGSGRTDSGVHAKGQVAHFDINTKVRGDKVFQILNKVLPDDIKILSSEEVDSNFHSRFSTKKKTYVYKFYTSEVFLPLLEFNHTKVTTKFDYKKAKSVLKYFKGTKDFKSFCSTNTKTKDTIRTIYDIKLEKGKDSTYSLYVTGNGFLYNMVRIIAGTIIEVGCGIKQKKDIKEIFNNKNRVLAGRTMPAKGLTLEKVEYN